MSRLQAYATDSLTMESVEQLERAAEEGRTMGERVRHKDVQDNLEKMVIESLRQLNARADDNPHEDRISTATVIVKRQKQYQEDLEALLDEMQYLHMGLLTDLKYSDDLRRQTASLGNHVEELTRLDETQQRLDTDLRRIVSDLTALGADAARMKKSYDRWMYTTIAIVVAACVLVPVFTSPYVALLQAPTAIVWTIYKYWHQRKRLSAIKTGIANMLRFERALSSIVQEIPDSRFLPKVKRPDTLLDVLSKLLQLATKEPLPEETAYFFRKASGKTEEGSRKMKEVIRKYNELTSAAILS